MNSDFLDSYPADAAIRGFHERMARAGEASVFSAEHVEVSTAFLSRRPVWKGPVFLAGWRTLGFLKTFEAPKLDVLVVENCRRTVREMSEVATRLSEHFQVGWFTSPVKRWKRKVPAGVIALDPVWSLGGAFPREGLEIGESQVDVKGWKGSLLRRMNCELDRRAVEFIRQTGARVVLLGSDGEQFGMALGAAAGRAGARVLVFQHGTQNFHNNWGTSDTLLCWSEMVKESVEGAVGVSGLIRKPPLHVEVVGGISSVSESVPPEDGPVLFLDQASRYGDQMWGEQWLSRSAEWLRPLAGLNVLRRIRLHPGASPERKRALDGWELSQEASFADDILRSRILITMNSTAGLQGGATGRPVIFLRGEGLVWLGSLEAVAELVVHSPEELFSRVSKLLEDPGYFAFYAQQSAALCRAYLGFPGVAPARIESFIQKILSRS